MTGKKGKSLVQQRWPAPSSRCSNLQIKRLTFDPFRQYLHHTFWHHVSSLDDAEEGVGHQIYVLHTQGVECGIALVFWFGRQGRIGNGALKHSPIWFCGTVNSSKDADHQDEEGDCPHGAGEEDPHPSCPPHHHHLLRSLQFIFLHQHNSHSHILRLKIWDNLRVPDSDMRSTMVPNWASFTHVLPPQLTDL